MAPREKVRRSLHRSPFILEPSNSVMPLSYKMTVADQAEDLVRLWATQAGLVSNQVQRDRAGWDQIFDLSAPRESHKNQDLLGLPSYALTARVQVKSTRGTRRAIPIRMSNWQRAIEDPLPWFYLVLRYEPGSSSPSEVAAVHLDKQLLERVMGHLYSLNSEDRAKLHKKKYSLTWTDRDLLTGEYPGALRARLEAAVPRDMFEYAAEKQQWMSKAGTPEVPNSQIRFSITAPNEDELFRRLSRAAVGLESNLAVSAVEHTRERFGSMHRVPEFPNDSNGAIQIGPARGGDQFRFGLIDDSGAHDLDMDALVRFSGRIIPGLPEKYWLTRIMTPCIDALFDHGNGKMHLTLRLPPDDQATSLLDLSKGLSLMKTLAERSGKNVLLTLAKEKTSVPLGVEVPRFDLDPDMSGLSIQVDAMVEALRALRIDPFPAMSIRAVRRLAPMASVILAAKGGPKPVLHMEWTVPDGASAPVGRVAVVFDAYLIINNMRYIQLLALQGIPTTQEADGQTRVTLLSNEISTVGSWRFLESESARFPFEQRVDEVEQRLLESGVTQVWKHRL